MQQEKHPVQSCKSCQICLYLFQSQPHTHSDRINGIFRIFGWRLVLCDVLGKVQERTVEPVRWASEDSNFLIFNLEKPIL